MESITGNIYTYQMGRIQVKSSQGDSYGMVIYNYDSNDILNWATKNEQKKQWQKNIMNCM